MFPSKAAPVVIPPASPRARVALVELVNVNAPAPVIRFVPVIKVPVETVNVRLGEMEIPLFNVNDAAAAFTAKL